MSNKKNQGNAFHESKEKPFVIAHDKGQYAIIVGNSLVSEKRFPTIRTAEEYIKQKPYELIINTSILIYKLMQKEKNENEKTN